MPAVTRLLALSLGLSVFGAVPFFGHAQSQKNEDIDYFKKWLKEDVVYIITNEEKAVFDRLTTMEEKEQFIEQFWGRRDETRGTTYNEFKEEHYRRIKYSNEQFAAGFPGWQSDRGKIYIKFGPPDQKTSNPSGGAYTREIYEGGGNVQTFPFERWWYRYIEGVGQDVEVEFVDRLNSNEYRIAQDSFEKEVGFELGMGETTYETLGLYSRAELNRARYLGNPSNPYMRSSRLNDQPLQRLSRYTQLMKPPKIRFDDLRTLVETRVNYDQLDVHLVSHVTPVHEDMSLVLLSAEIEINNDNFDSVGEGVWRAETNIYGRLSNLTGQIAFEFDDDVAAEIRKDPALQLQTSRLYQRKVPLKGGRYKLQIVVREGKTKRIGTLNRLVVVPGQTPELRGMVMLADRAKRVREGETVVDPFVVTEELKVYPDIHRTFTPSEQLGVFLEVHNLAVDMSKQAADVRLSYRVLSEGQPVPNFEKVLQPQKIGNDSVVNAFFAIPLEGLTSGKYTFQVDVTDLVSDKQLVLKDIFEIRPKSASAASN